MTGSGNAGTPVALFVHRRPAYLPDLIDRICDARPPRVYLFADGPRTHAEAEYCHRCRQLLDATDWPCEVYRDYSEVNLGCNGRLLSGLDLAFSENDELIVLEDDTRVSGSFFGYCDEMLHHYRSDPSVMMISGINPLGCWPAAEADYLFSGIGNAQAWASWRHAWQHVGSARQAWDSAAVRRRVSDFIDDEQQFEARARIYSLPDDAPDNSWDYRWALARQMRGGLCAVPRNSLAIHAGRGETATHVRQRSILDEVALLSEVTFPMRHAEHVARDTAYDRFLHELTSNSMCDESALKLARMLVSRNKQLLARAVLTHQFGSSAHDQWQRLNR